MIAGSVLALYTSLCELTQRRMLGTCCFCMHSYYPELKNTCTHGELPSGTSSCLNQCSNSDAAGDVSGSVFDMAVQ